MTELTEHKIKRLYMRSIRRGIKEMDLILTAFADARLAGMDDASLDLYDGLLNENDHDLYQWVTGQVPAPEHLTQMIEDIRALYEPLA
ncbi:MAG: succinate dehydrogenase assembly factor 2 [Sulfitobacter sp.]|jgi:antitoxin CptB|nr:succinate dehydrogenase assembly factor 2 [Sulfitobacter sp.]